MPTRIPLRALAALMVLTWGFSLYAYDRLQRVSGFWERPQCEHVRAEVERIFTGAVVAESCTEDT